MMKQLRAFFAGVLVTLVFAASAATLTINTTAGEDTRIAVAFGKKLGLPGNASAGQIKADVIVYIQTVVADQERIAASLTANGTPVAPN